ncbi:MAG TPA: hypothetical protein VGE82_03190 [Nitrososphaera sp.]
MVGQQKCFTDVVRAQHFVNVVSNGEANQRDQKVARIDRVLTQIKDQAGKKLATMRLMRFL